MNKKKQQRLYDTHSTGERIRSKRIALGLSQEELASQIKRATKYYSDIERGSCGMSIDTMLALSKSLDMSLDYMIFGIQKTEEIERVKSQEASLTHILAQCDSHQHEYVIRLMQLMLASMSHNKDLPQKEEK